ncbi:MAG: tRNA pseudouridine(38-40) synthase TruA [Phycisphaerales bacterium]|nr:tRNA pseudouridine(38-40) synthase TruA [Phycisphaerales bacterium]
MPRFRLQIAYDGTDFHGWQRQEPPGLPPLRTAQGVLTEAVVDLFGMGLKVDGASRTDSGVHARGQVAAFTVENPRIPIERLAMALNTRLPRDIEVRVASRVNDDFDPVRHCVSKSYSYHLRHGDAGRPPGLEGRADPFERLSTAHVRHHLDLTSMRTASAPLTGTHDYRAFAHNPDERETTIRTVHGISVNEARPGVIRFDVAGSGFLHHMVRIIVGTLVEVGRGRTPPDRVGEIMAARDRSRAGPTMPPEGLCLEWIHYGGADGAPVGDDGAPRTAS